MISEQKKYISIVYRNMGFALFTPSASILFQWLVFEKGGYFGHFVASVIVFLLGVVFITYGYVLLKEKENQ